MPKESEWPNASKERACEAAMVAASRDDEEPFDEPHHNNAGMRTPDPSMDPRVGIMHHACHAKKLIRDNFVDTHTHIWGLIMGVCGR